MPKQILVTIVSFFLCCAGSVAQSELATLTGIVTDTSGAVIPGVEIAVTNEATNIIACQFIMAPLQWYTAKEIGFQVSKELDYLPLSVFSEHLPMSDLAS